jgi:cytochrome c peroxidase
VAVPPRSIPLRRPALALAAVLACAACRAVDPADANDPGYPDGPHAVAEGQILPDLVFEGATESGARGEIHLHDYFAPRAPRASLLLIAVSGGLWCGTCRWYGVHAGEIAARAGGDAVQRLDVVIGDRDDAPARAEDAAAWRERFDLRGTAVAADPGFSFGAALAGRSAPLPLLLLVDRRSMRVTSVLSNPAPEDLEARIAADRAALDGRPAPPPPAEDLVDGLFHRNEWDLLAETTLPGAPPDDPTNAVADDPAARDLGRALFFDPGLSPSNDVSCATCHDPGKQLSDGLPVARGAAIGDRRTPSIALAAHAHRQFWDGRADTLWAQALGPIEDPKEMASSRLFVARRVAAHHGAAYARAFPGAPLPDTSGWPAHGKPGDAAYDAMPGEEKDAATRVLVNAGKAIAAYERTFRVQPNALDAYLGGARDALTPLEKYGLLTFVRAGCMQCHWGPRLTDDAFHVTRTPTGRRDHAADRGRLDGLAAWRASDFRATGRWSDAPDAADAPRDDAPPGALLGQFETPPLRGVADLTRWGHGGTFDALAGVTEAYGRGGVPAGDPSSAGAREPWLPGFGETMQWALVPFLKTLHARPVVP